MKVDVSLREGPFEPTSEWAELVRATGGGAGAIAAFCGLVRDRHAGESVEALTLEHYPGMTETSIACIVADAGGRWPLDAVRVVHRVGRIEAREPIVMVLVAAGHREAAFAACELIMDFLKTDAVFWKKEHTTSGERWVDSTARDHARATSWRPK